VRAKELPFAWHFSFGAMRPNPALIDNF